MKGSAYSTLAVHTTAVLIPVTLHSTFTLLSCVNSSLAIVPRLYVNASSKNKALFTFFVIEKMMVKVYCSI